MRISAEYKPWLLTPTDSSRPVLEHVLIERTGETEGRLVAADGFSMGIFPVQLDPEDEPGLLSARVLRYASQFTEIPNQSERPPGALYCYSIELDADWAYAADGSRHRRNTAPADSKYPIWREIIDKQLTMVAPPTSFFINPQLLRWACAAIGASNMAHLLPIAAGSHPVVVVPYGPSVGLRDWNWEQARFAFALVMPLKDLGG